MWSLTQVWHLQTELSFLLLQTNKTFHSVEPIIMMMSLPLISIVLHLCVCFCVWESVREFVLETSVSVCECTSVFTCVRQWVSLWERAWVSRCMGRKWEWVCACVRESMSKCVCERVWVSMGRERARVRGGVGCVCVLIDMNPYPDRYHVLSNILFCKWWMQLNYRIVTELRF